MKKSASRIEAVVFDAMNTLIEVRGSRQDLLAAVYGKVLGKPVNPLLLHAAYRHVRANALVDADWSRRWARIHQRILSELMPRSRASLAIGREIHEMVMSDPDLYRVPRETIAFLRAAKRRFRLAIASNQERRFLEPMLEHFGISEHVERVFCSDELGVAKPSPKFFEKVFAELGVSPALACYVGNSIENDLPAYLVGCRVVIINRKGAPRVALPRIRMVRNVAELREELDKLPAGNT